jgi:hypothetical protein
MVVPQAARVNFTASCEVVNVAEHTAPLVRAGRNPEGGADSASRASSGSWMSAGLGVNSSRGWLPYMTPLKMASSVLPAASSAARRASRQAPGRLRRTGCGSRGERLPCCDPCGIATAAIRGFRSRCGPERPAASAWTRRFLRRPRRCRRRCAIRLPLAFWSTWSALVAHYSKRVE